MARSAEAEESGKLGEVQGAKLDPIGFVERVLTRPDGTQVIAQVPVYPPFRLAEAASPRRAARGRSAPSLKHKLAGPRPKAGEAGSVPRPRRRPRSEDESR